MPRRNFQAEICITLVYHFVPIGSQFSGILKSCTTSTINPRWCGAASITALRYQDHIPSFFPFSYQCWSGYDSHINVSRICPTRRWIPGTYNPLCFQEGYRIFSGWRKFSGGRSKFCSISCKTSRKCLNGSVRLVFDGPLKDVDSGLRCSKCVSLSPARIVQLI